MGPNSALEGLPLEVQIRMSKFLDESHLRALGQTNRHFRSLCHQRWGRSIRVVVQRGEEMQQQLSVWNQRLQTLGHDTVWHFRFEGCLYFSADADDDDRLYRALATFITSLPRLRTLHYYSGNRRERAPIPRFLVDAIEQNSGCRLHLISWDPRNRDDANIHPDDYALLTSPNLETLHSTYEFGLRAEALLEASRVNPSLKRLSLYEFGGRSGPYPDRPVWHGFSNHDAIPPSQLGQLEELDLASSAGYLDSYRRLVDFSQLKRLNLGSLKAWGIRGLCRLTPPLDLTSLQELVLPVLHHDYVSQDSRDFDNFLSGLPPLSKLTISANPTRDTWNTIVSYHAPSLVDFAFNLAETRRSLDAFMVGRPQMTALPAAFCRLRRLDMAIRRPEDSADEVATYRTLGMVPTLQEILLTLDVRQPGLVSCDWDEGVYLDIPRHPSSDDWDNQYTSLLREAPRKGHYKDALIRATTGGALARSIFQCISEARKQAHKPRFLLESLVVQTSGMMDFEGDSAPDGFSRLFRTVSQAWLVERGERDDQRHQLFDRLAAPPPTNMQWANDHSDLDEETEELFSKVWPDWKQRNPHWKQAWHGFPLAEYDD